MLTTLLLKMVAAHRKFVLFTTEQIFTNNRVNITITISAVREVCSSVKKLPVPNTQRKFTVRGQGTPTNQSPAPSTRGKSHSTEGATAAALPLNRNNRRKTTVIGGKRTSTGGTTAVNADVSHVCCNNYSNILKIYI